MKLLRSWPETVPAGRSYVQDNMDRLVMTGHDYRVLDDVDDDVLLIEWDIAVDRDDLTAFADQARANPERVLVAPYQLYDELDGSVCWTHRRYTTHPDDPACRLRPVAFGEPSCHLFGLGMAYLPQVLVRRFLTEWSGHFSDGSFSGWHYRKSDDPEVPIAWNVRPVHLHYQLDPAIYS